MEKALKILHRINYKLNLLNSLNNVTLCCQLEKKTLLTNVNW